MNGKNESKYFKIGVKLPCLAVFKKEKDPYNSDFEEKTVSYISY